MSLIIGIKVFSDLCLYFAFAGSLFDKACQGMTPGWGILVCAAGTALAAGLSRKWPAARLIGLAGPALSLLTASTLPHILLLLPAMAYTAAVIASGRFDTDHSRCCEVFPRQLAGLCVLLVLALLGMADRRCALLYGGLHALSAFFLLRQLRLEQVGNWQNKLLNLLTLLAAVGGGAALCLAVWGVFQLPFTLWNLVGGLFYLLAYALQILYVVIEWLVKWLSGLVNREAMEVSPMEFATMEPLFENSEVQQNPLARVILTCLLALIVTGIAVLVIRRMLRSLRKPPAYETRQTHVERIDFQPQTGNRAILSSNRDKLRGCYRKFLKLLRSRGVDLDPSLTTEEIQRCAGAVTDRAAAETLRSLYLPARYDEGTEVTSQQVKDAKALLKTLRRELEP